MKKLVMICAAALFIAGTVGADPIKSYTPVLTGTPIDFEGHAEGTLISNQYPGVTFGQDDGGTPMIDNYSWLYGYGSSSGSAVLTGSMTGGAPYPTVAGITLDFSVSHVQLFFSDTAPLGDYTISAYDAGSVLLESFTVLASETLPPGYTGGTFPPPGTSPLPGIYVGFARTVADIAKIQVGRSSAEGDAFAIDDVLFSVEPIEVTADIKPGSCPNPFNPKSKGSVPVGIVGTEGLDGEDLAALIDPTDICLMIGTTLVCALDQYEIVDSTEPTDSDPFDCSDCFEEYLNCDLWNAGTIAEPIDPPIPGQDGVLDSYCGDGIPDFVVKFDTQEIADAIAAEFPDAVRDDCIEVILVGQTINGQEITGADSFVYKSKK